MDARCILQQEPEGSLTVFSCRVWQAVKPRFRGLARSHAGGQMVEEWRMELGWPEISPV